MFNIKKVIYFFLFFTNITENYAFTLLTSRRNFLIDSLLLSNSRNNKILLNHSNSDINNNIYFNGQVTEEACFQLSQALSHHRELSIQNEFYPNHINLYIQSPGGSLLPTLGLIDEIKNYDIDIHTYVKGYAASAATLLSVVGKKRYIYKNSLMMIHGIQLNEQTVSTVLDVKDLNYNIDLFMSIITDIYLENSNIDKKSLYKLFEHDIWLDSKNALHYGFVDKIL